MSVRVGELDVKASSEMHALQKKIRVARSGVMVEFEDMVRLDVVGFRALLDLYFFVVNDGYSVFGV